MDGPKERWVEVQLVQSNISPQRVAHVLSNLRDIRPATFPGKSNSSVSALV
jgi:hypothetical protein